MVWRKHPFFVFVCGKSRSDKHCQFLDIPASTPDLATHMEHLTCLYPVEPVERAALRFCEALAQWRGKPELETVSPHLLSHPI